MNKSVFKWKVVFIHYNNGKSHETGHQIQEHLCPDFVPFFFSLFDPVRVYVLNS